MTITILSVGKIKERYTLDWEAELTKRISPYSKIEFIEIKEEPITTNKSLDIVKEKESENIIAKIPERSFVIALDPKGKSLSSKDFAEKIQSIQNQSSHITFIIGGPAGFSREFLEYVGTRHGAFSLSFSQFTFTHQVMRVLLLEQIYRAFCILNNRPYHL